MEIKGGGSLGVSGSTTTMTVHEVTGDKSGRITIRQQNSLAMTQERVLLPFAILAQRQSQVMVPKRVDCRKLDIIMKGELLCK